MYLVVGLGKTGYSIARYLQRRNEPFQVFDTRSNPPDLEEFYQEFPNVDIFLSHLPDAVYTSLSTIINSPGVSLEEPFIQKAIQLGIPVIGDIECLAREIRVPIIAITGTNGKSTVTTLVGEMAKASGLLVAVAGNIGLPVLDMLDVGAQYDAWVLELSSFQLEVTTSLAPLAATILNITPDHLDRHHTLEAYIQLKQRVYHHAQILIYNREDTQTYPADSIDSQAQIISYGLDAPSEGHWGLVIKDEITYLAKGEQCFLAVQDLKIQGMHNWLNALAACALVETLGVSLSYMKEVLTRFPGLPHRSQWVRTLEDVHWINDSKGTNVGATVSAISGIGSSMSGKIVLIAGGQGKGADFTELAKPLADYGRCVVLIGEDADKIEQAVASNTMVFHASSLQLAVEMAKNQAQPGDVVLLSPACASFDMFANFNHRGDEFMAEVNAL